VKRYSFQNVMSFRARERSSFRAPIHSAISSAPIGVISSVARNLPQQRLSFRPKGEIFFNAESLLEASKISPPALSLRSGQRSK
jgi:hypothetical protein